MGATLFGVDLDVNGGNADSQISWSEAESSRFGIPIYRLTLRNAPSLVSDLRDSLDSLPTSGLLLLNLVNCDLDFFTDMEQEFGRRIVICTPSVDWQWTAGRQHARAWSVSTDRALEQLDNSRALTEIPRLVAAAFSDYRNHHWEDTLLRPNLDLGSAYAEWAASELQTGIADSYVLRRASEAECFLLDHELPEGGRRILLAATLRDFRNRGCYTEMLKKYLGAMAVKDQGRVRITTQVSNVRVQRRWAVLGFRPESLIRHVHIWPLGIDPGATRRTA